MKMVIWMTRCSNDNSKCCLYNVGLIVNGNNEHGNNVNGNTAKIQM